MPITLTAGVASPEPTPPLPTVKITAPTKDQVIPADKVNEFAVKLDVKNWQTATGSSHVHLILDNKPYKAIYDTKAPVKLSELTAGAAIAIGGGSGRSWLATRDLLGSEVNSITSSLQMRSRSRPSTRWVATC